jgi:hypothetical protein
MRQTLTRSLTTAATIEADISAFIQQTESRQELLLHQLNRVQSRVADVSTLQKSASPEMQPKFRQSFLTLYRQQRLLQNQLQIIEAQLFTLGQITFGTKLRIDPGNLPSASLPSGLAEIEIEGSADQFDTDELLTDVTEIIGFLRSPFSETDDLTLESEFEELNEILSSRVVPLGNL